MPIQPEELRYARAGHREHVPASLEVVVGQNRSPDYGKVRVRPHEVVRDLAHEVKQASQRRTVHVHRPVPVTHHDAVFLEVGVGAVLKSPFLSPERNRDDAEVLPGGMSSRIRCRPAAIALVLTTEGACGVFLAHARRRRSGDVTRVLFGLRLVDGDLEVAPARGAGPLEVPRDGGLPDVVDVAAQPIEPIGCRNGPLAPRNRPEAPAHLGRPCHNRPHEPH